MKNIILKNFSDNGSPMANEVFKQMVTSSKLIPLRNMPGVFKLSNQHHDLLFAVQFLKKYFMHNNLHVVANKN